MADSKSPARYDSAMFDDFVLCQINPVMGDVAGNARHILDIAKKQSRESLCVFPELALVGYPPEDLVLSPALREAVEKELPKLVQALKDGPAILLGAPVWERNVLCPFNACLLIEGGEIKAIVKKHDLPNYNVFDDKRIFTSGPLPPPILYKGRKLGVMICEDMWTSAAAEHLKQHGAECLVVVNASPYEMGKHEKRRLPTARERVRESGLPLLYVNQIGGQDDLLFDGRSFVMDGQGNLLRHLPAFQEIAHPVAEEMSAPEIDWRQELYDGLVLALRDYVHKNNAQGAVIGLSGGIDSALVAAIAADALGPQKLRCITMPSRFNSNESIEDAADVAAALNLSMEMQPIESLVQAFESQLKLTSGIPHENMQSRVRGTVLMALSNANSGWLVLSTTNKSELAVGYGTLYGDMAGAFAPIRDLYKREVAALSVWRGIPERVLKKPPSAELREGQKDQDSLPPYDVLDSVLFQLIEENKKPDEVTGCDKAVRDKIVHLLRINEFKRRQGPLGPKVSVKAFGRDRRFPVTNASE